MTKSRPRIVVMISGGGSNLQALIDATTSGVLAADIVAVVSNRKAAYGLVRAEQAGIPTVYFPLRPYRVDGRGREAYDADLGRAIAPYAPDLIVLAGWMHINSAAFLNQFPHKVINLHPALPGQFDGLHAIERAWAAYEAGDLTYSGCMVHEAIVEVDAGDPIVTARVPIFSADAFDDFAARMHRTEHKIIVLATKITLDLL